jgi:hypothetical protein
VSPAARRIKLRAVKLLGMEPYDDEMTDGLQVLRYNVSTAYITHTDYLEDNGSGHDYDSANMGSNRFATLLFYLSDVEGESSGLFFNVILTVFISSVLSVITTCESLLLQMEGKHCLKKGNQLTMATLMFLMVLQLLMKTNLMLLSSTA